jgi:hypothetical protein
MLNHSHPQKNHLRRSAGSAAKVLEQVLSSAIDRIGRVAHWIIGVVSSILGLALLATIPIIQVLSLGYLLDVSRRVTQGGRLRDGWFGMEKAARMGGIVLFSWLFLWPARVLAGYWYDATLVAPGSERASQLHGWLLLVIVLTLTHIAWACFRGGRFRHFIWPAPVLFVRTIRRRGNYREARDRCWDFMLSLNVPYYFKLGFRGSIGAIAWLLIPVLLLIGGTTIPNGGLAVLSGLLGYVLLTIVLLFLPFLQTRFACEQTWSAMFDWRGVRQLFQRAPIAFWMSLTVTLLFATPLYLLKIELTPREVLILPSIAFVIFSWPARLLCGWAVGRAERRETPRWFVSRWFARLAIVPTAAIFALVVFLTRYTSWYGHWSLLEQHAFLVPVPFLGG